MVRGGEIGVLGEGETMLGSLWQRGGGRGGDGGVGGC